MEEHAETEELNGERACGLFFLFQKGEKMDSNRILQALTGQDEKTQLIRNVLFEIHAVNVTLLEIELRMTKDEKQIDLILDKLKLEADWMKNACETGVA